MAVIHISEAEAARHQQPPEAAQKLMGLILDSSIVITAERRGDTVEKLIEQVVAVATAHSS
jgi:hypothetical protein